MNEQQVVALMRSSVSEDDWNYKCSEVKKACGGYPEFWYSAIVMSRIMQEVAARWGSNDRIRVTTT